MKPLQTLSLIAITTLFTACGGGDTPSGGTPVGDVTTTTTMKGTVPGTLIEAFGSDGSYISVKSTQNGTTKHPFSIKLLKSVNYRLVMTTNEDDNASRVVTPIGFVVADKNETLFTTTSNTIDLGDINLSLDRNSINDVNNDGVVDDIKYLTVSSNDLDVVRLANDPTDSDGDGLLNVYEDDDNDETPNRYDDDDDGDGILDINDNDHNNDGTNDNDLDGDGVTNDKDIDLDNDGLINRNDTDDDNDGTPDTQDNDDDNDGTADTDDNDGTKYGDNDDRNGNGDNDDRNGNDDDDRNGDRN